MVDKQKHQKCTDHTQPASAQLQPSAQASTSQSSGSSRNPGSALSTHNQARSTKKLSGLQWDDNLAKDAQAYAEKIAAKDRMAHAGIHGQGENPYMSTGDATYEQAVQAWLDEEKDYGGEKIGEGDFTKWGHFCESCIGDGLRGGRR